MGSSIMSAFEIAAFPFADGELTSFFVTVGIAIVAFALFGGILAIPALRGRKIKRTCACAESKRVMRILEERERAERDARRYAPETVDVARLPIASAELAEWARSTESTNDSSAS